MSTSTAATMLRFAHMRTTRFSQASLALRRMASTNSASSWGLKDPSLVKFQNVVGGAWIDAKNGATIKVQSKYLM
jgi:hypothetical protein